MSPEWYETYGDYQCLRCGKPIIQSESKCIEYGCFCEIHASDILMGVGSLHYPTPEDFIKEAEAVGCSKRIGNYFPEAVKPLISRCFLIHNKTKEVFGFFFIRNVEIIVKDGTDLSKELQSRGVKPIKVSEILSEPPRGCGQRLEAGAYAVCYELRTEDFERIIKDPALVDKVDIKGPLVVLKDPLIWEDLNYTIRGFLYIDGDQIIQRRPPKDWRWKQQ